MKSEEGGVEKVSLLSLLPSGNIILVLIFIPPIPFYSIPFQSIPLSVLGLRLSLSLSLPPSLPLSLSLSLSLSVCVCVCMLLYIPEVFSLSILQRKGKEMTSSGNAGSLVSIQWSI